MERGEHSKDQSWGPVNHDETDPCRNITINDKSLHSFLFFLPDPSYRFAEEAEAVRADIRVHSLQSALEKSAIKYANFKKVCGTLRS